MSSAALFSGDHAWGIKAAMSRVPWAIGTAVLAVIGSLWYVLAPPRTAGDYRERAAMTAETLRSQVETAALWVRELDEGDVTRQASSVALREAERDATAAASKFAGWDPRGETREIRSELTLLASEVAGALARLRIAAEDDRWSELPTLAQPLPHLAQRLEAVARQADP
ncbi:MAG: hypothetical protein M3327_00615 [Actinomycetota bacterium]|nr:hypothetical protein [Actinomycetota bacterium]